MTQQLAASDVSATPHPTLFVTCGDEVEIYTKEAVRMPSSETGLAKLVQKISPEAAVEETVRPGLYKATVPFKAYVEAMIDKVIEPMSAHRASGTTIVKLPMRVTRPHVALDSSPGLHEIDRTLGAIALRLAGRGR